MPLMMERGTRASGVRPALARMASKRSASARYSKGTVTYVTVVPGRGPMGQVPNNSPIPAVTIAHMWRRGVCPLSTDRSPRSR